MIGRDCYAMEPTVEQCYIAIPQGIVERVSVPDNSSPATRHKSLDRHLSISSTTNDVDGHSLFDVSDVFSRQLDFTSRAILDSAPDVTIYAMSRGFGDRAR